MTEGVDYSRGGPMTVGALRTTGKRFVGRYAVNDKSPGGRGITGSEYRNMTQNGIDVFLYWEAEAEWMTGGWDRGVAAAENALDNIRNAGMPERMPIYYSHDIDPRGGGIDGVIQCLRGAASVVGIERVGLYGGWALIDLCAREGHAKWFCQPLAWQWDFYGNGQGLHPAAHLYQYQYNVWIGGVNCDSVRAVKEHYGQASDFVERPTTTTTLPPFPHRRIEAPDEWHAQGFALVRNANNRFVCTQGGHFKTYPHDKAPNGVETPYKANKPYTFDWRTKDKVNGEVWYVSKYGSWAPSKNFRQDTRP